MSNLKNRLAKIEQKLSDASDGGAWVRVVINIGETKQAACDRWQLDNLDTTMPDNIVYRVIV